MVLYWPWRYSVQQKGILKLSSPPPDIFFSELVNKEHFNFDLLSTNMRLKLVLSTLMVTSLASAISIVDHDNGMQNL